MDLESLNGEMAGVEPLSDGLGAAEMITGVGPL